MRMETQLVVQLKTKRCTNLDCLEMVFTSHFEFCLYLGGIRKHKTDYPLFLSLMVKIPYGV